MRIALHTAMAFEPSRGTQATRHSISASSTPGAAKLTSVSAEPAATVTPFTRLFQTFNPSTTGLSTPKVVSATSVFSPMVTAAPGPATTTAAATDATPAIATPAPATVTAPAAAPAAAAPTPGIQALVSAIMNGSFQATYVTDPSKLQETTPAGTDTMPNFYYASDQTANQLASLLGGKVVQRPAFGQDQGWTEPLANFIQLPSGQTVNAADLAYYAHCGPQGPAQLTADLTQTINEGAAWTNYYNNGGQMPTFPMGYVGPPISGMTYPQGSIGADGNVINPAMQGLKT